MSLRKAEILFEDNHLLIVNKPSGILTQGDNTGDESLLEAFKGYIKKNYNKPGNVYLGLPHRIDRPVSGLVILARTSKALERMTRQFQENKVKKTYWAMVKKAPPQESGNLINWLWKDQNKNITRVHQSGKKGAKKAELSYQLLGRIGDYYLLEIYPQTGRPHQIRVQLAHMGCPIVGDVKYNYAHKNKDGSIQLHARKLDFTHPVTQKPISIEADLPDSPLWQLFREF